MGDEGEGVNRDGAVEGGGGGEEGGGEAWGVGGVGVGPGGGVRIGAEDGVDHRDVTFEDCGFEGCHGRVDSG